MDGERLRNVVEGLWRAAGAGAEAAPLDADLLGRWIEGRDQAAFELLVYRHAPMVLGVCRRILHDVHEAEDALQAAFLVLARKAASIGRRQALAGWLYRVACRAALRARSRLARRPAQNERALDNAAVPASEELLWRDLRPLLDEAVARLPEKLRAAFVLCHLEGRTNEEAARELRCPVGTLLSRLSRARERLRFRLTRRGLTLPAGGLAAVGTGAIAQASVPAALVAATMRSAVGFVSDAVAGCPVSEVASLAKGVLRTMFLAKMFRVAMGVVAVLAVGLGVAVASRLATAQTRDPLAEQAPKKKVATPQAKKGAEEERLKKSLLETARHAYRQQMELLKAAAVNFPAEELSRWSRRWLQAQLDLAGKPDERKAALRDHLTRMRDLLKITEMRYKIGQGRAVDATAARYHCLQAELWVARGSMK